MQKFYHKKSMGQNFLQNKSIITRIIQSANMHYTKTAIIEIGPGKGALTELIIQNCKKLILIELDAQLIDLLEEKYKDYNNVKIIKADILVINLRQLIEKELGEFEKEDIKIISNLPYYITSPILFKLFSINNYISEFVLMMQKEVGDRILADVNEKKYNNLSIVSKLYCDITKVITVGKNNFYPIPKVDSVVLRFKNNKKYILDDEKEFINFIRVLFNNRRKIINNNVSKYLEEHNKKIVANLLLNSNINSMLRPQNLSLKNYYDLWINIKKRNKNK